LIFHDGVTPVSVLTLKLLLRAIGVLPLKPRASPKLSVSQISYSLVVILELSGVLEVQYKEIMMSSINKNN